MKNKVRGTLPHISFPFHLFFNNLELNDLSFIEKIAKKIGGIIRLNNKREKDDSTSPNFTKVSNDAYQTVISTLSLRTNSL